MLDLYVRLNFAVEAKEISALFFFYYLKTGGGYDYLNDIPQAAQQDTIHGGSGRVVYSLVAKLQKQGVKCVLSNPVEEVNTGEDGIITVVGETESYRTKYVISAVPPLVSRLSLTPLTPQVATKDNVYPRHARHKTPVVVSFPNGYLSQNVLRVRQALLVRCRFQRVVVGG